MSKTDDEWFQVGLTDICAALHEGRTGTGDPMSDGDQQSALDYLQRRLFEWTPSHGDSAGYDDAIRTLVTATMAEFGRCP